MIGIGAGPFDYLFRQAMGAGGPLTGSAGTMPAAPSGPMEQAPVMTGLLSPFMTGVATSGGASSGTAQAPAGPVYPSILPFTGSAPTMAGALGSMMGGAPPPRDIRRYGMGPEHLFFSGANGHPYGLAAATGVTPQQLMQNDMLQQLLEALRGQQAGDTLRGYLGYATGDGGVGGGFGGGTAGDGFGGPNGDAGIGGDAGTGHG